MPRDANSHGDDSGDDLFERMRHHLFDEPAPPLPASPDEHAAEEDEGHHADPGEGRPTVDDGLIGPGQG